MTQSEAGSVVVSLAELMTIEDERIEAEEQARVAADQAREYERQQCAHRQREAEQARLAAEQQRRLEQQAQAREEAARLEALEKATIEQARVDAERRARLQVQSEDQKHQAALAALQRDHQIRRLRTWLAATAAVVVLGGGVGAFLWHQDHMSGELALAAQTTESQQLQTANARLERDKNNAVATVKQLKAELADAEREVERERERADAEEAKADFDEPASRSTLRRPHRPTEQPAGPKCRFRGDPLCGLDGRSAIP